MRLTDRIIKRQIELIRPITDASGLEFSRSGQDRLGKLMRFTKREEIVLQDSETADGMKVSLVIPRDEVRSGLILYMHGGGYVSGGLDYAKGFASILSAELGMRVLTYEYRLAPEHPYPAALDDSLKAYLYALGLGYTGENIVFAGESAGGGLCYAVMLRIKEEGLPKPAGIIAISPWCDLTGSGESYETNKDADPSLTRERLEFFAESYVGSLEFHGKKKSTRAVKLAMKRKKSDMDEFKKLPYVSPVFGELDGMPPSLILAGGDEILLSDSKMLHEKLVNDGSQSRLIVKEKMWHAYPLFNLKSQSGDFTVMNNFVKSVLPSKNQRKLRWMGIDNAGKIYPAAASSRWSNVFRLSATLTEDVDRSVLQSALDVTVRRFPSIAVRLRRGTFWYYLEEIRHAPAIKDEKSHPITRMTKKDIRTCAFRVLVYKKRIAVEFFHALTDGNGGMIFLKSLIAEYLTEKYSIEIPAENGVFDRLEPPNEEEFRDNFPSVAGEVSKSRRDTDSYRIYGTHEPDSFLNVTTFIFDTDELLSKARAEGVTLTAYLAAVFVKSAIDLQDEDIVHKRNKRRIKILVPFDLRRYFKGKEKTLRNFVLYICPGIDPRLGEYTHSEIAKIISHQMALEITPKNISAMVRTNVGSEQHPLLKIMPLFIKNAAMKLAFNMLGERKSTITMSNLGAVKLPDIMYDYVDRFDFTLGVQARAPYNSGFISYKDRSYLNIIRNIVEPRLEMALYRTFRELGIHIKVESNQRD